MMRQATVVGHSFAARRGVRHQGMRSGETPLREKIEDLKEVALTLLHEVKALEQAPTGDVRHGLDFYEEVRRFECALIRRALEQTKGHQGRAARLLGLKVTTLNSMIKRYNLIPGMTAAGIATPDSPPPVNHSQ